MQTEENQNKAQLFVVMEQEILCRKDLSITAKLVYARMSGFKEFWESPENTGLILGKSPRTIISARQELERKGLIKCIRNTGRGKAYMVVRLTEIEQSDYQKLGSQTTRNMSVYNKIKNKEENNNIVPILLEQDAPAQQETYGNADVNYCFDRFREVFGYDMKPSQVNRRAAYNFMRAKNKGKDWFDKILMVWYASRNDQYSVRISDFADLQQKQDKLMEWAMRKALKEQNNSMEIPL